MSDARTILIIDDDVHFNQVLCRSLERQGFSVLSSHTTEEALLLASQHTIDWVALDLRLEQESGLSLIKPLLGLQPQLRIVMLTGYASIPTAVEAVKLGAYNYLHKPATLQELLSAFDDVAEHSDLPAAEHTVNDVMSIDRMEWEHIQRVLSEQQGNISATARLLNMHRRTLQRKLQKYAPR
ncbi:MAG: response regulator [Bacterioplanes sp.]|nr:response regulator [Bacterioplanes sp.]